MTLQELATICGGTVQVATPAGASITSAYTSDMLSDVMAHAPGDSALITIQNHINTVAICTLVGVKSIVICHDRDIPDDMRRSAEREGVGIITTPLSQFDASCVIGTALGKSKV